MKHKLSDVVNGYYILTSFKAKLSFKLAWAIEDLKDALKKHFERFDKERIDLVKELGEETDAATGQYKINDQEQFVKRLNEILETEVDVEAEPLSMDSLEKSNLELSADELKGLKPFIK